MTSPFRLAAALGALIAGLTLPGVVLAARSGGGSASSPSWTFVSAPGLHPPKLQVLTRKPGLAQGDFLAAPTPIYGSGNRTIVQGGLMILDSHARPVWFLPVKGQAFDVGQQTYQGKPVLVWFEGGSGQVNPGGPQNPGQVVIYDEHYRKIASLKARSPWMTDLHDAWITGGDIWITVARGVANQNLTPYGGPRDGSVLDVGLQEFQLSTGRLLRTWDALNPGGQPNVSLSASEERPGPGPRPNVWDAYHLNSVQALPNGDLLVSMRNTWAVYLIDPVSDKILWTLGGKDSTFKHGSGASFAWQHDARLVHPSRGAQGSAVELTLFNDNNGDAGGAGNPSAGMVLSLNTVGHTATLLSAYRHHPPLSARVLGSMQLLPNGNALVGWGSEPYFSEYTPSGQELLDVRWPGDTQSYRTLFTNTWIGKPHYPPRGAVSGKTVYASWNGATQVAKWDVLAGSSASSLEVVATGARTGFETATKLTKSYSAYEVRALSASGQTLGTSKGFS